jgi:hypothetical protein
MLNQKKRRKEKSKPQNIKYLISLVAITNGNFSINLQGNLSSFTAKKNNELKGNNFMKCDFMKLPKWKERNQNEIK